MGSFRTIKEALADFCTYSGLQPNLCKSAVFFSAVDEIDKGTLRGIMDISEAAFPVKFLGVPLISSRLKYGDCVVLKERILARIQSWANKRLSYGGRALLIQSVLFNM